MKPIQQVMSGTAILPRADIDTDQIIPARFLTTTTRQGLGEHVFADWRYTEAGEEDPDFPLHQEDQRGAQVLVTGNNFGCGSSREHAPWALLDYGISVVISTEIADIFRSNALKNGLLPIVLDESALAILLARPRTVSVDLVAQTVAFTDDAGTAHTERFEIDSFARYCLLKGIDQLGFLLDQTGTIERYESARPA